MVSDKTSTLGRKLYVFHSNSPQKEKNTTMIYSCVTISNYQMVQLFCHDKNEPNSSEFRGFIVFHATALVLRAQRCGTLQRRTQLQSQAPGSAGGKSLGTWWLCGSGVISMAGKIIGKSWNIMENPQTKWSCLMRKIWKIRYTWAL